MGGDGAGVCVTPPRTPGEGTGGGAAGERAPCETPPEAPTPRSRLAPAGLSAARPAPGLRTHVRCTALAQPGAWRGERENTQAVSSQCFRPCIRRAVAHLYVTAGGTRRQRPGLHLHHLRLRQSTSGPSLRPPGLVNAQGRQRRWCVSHHHHLSLVRDLNGLRFHHRRHRRQRLTNRRWWLNHRRRLSPSPEYGLDGVHGYTCPVQAHPKNPFKGWSS
jgi:hypothetical protein